MLRKRTVAIIVCLVMSLNACNTDNPEVSVDTERDEPAVSVVPEDENDGETDGLNNAGKENRASEIVKHLLDGDYSKDETESIDAPDGSMDNAAEDEADEQPIVSGWDMTYEDIELTLEYTAPTYRVVEQGMTLDEQYKSLINEGQYNNFTEGQLSMIEDNGFVVMQPTEYPMKKMHFSYEVASYSELPIFVTTDAVLNMWHLFYSESLKVLEVGEYYDKMTSFSKQMLEEIEVDYKDASDELKEELQYVYAYVACGNQLLTGASIELPKEVEALVHIEMDNIDAGLIAQSPLYNQDVDYSQYVVRGHYESSDLLSYYFRGMMWFSQTGFQLSQGLGEEIKVNWDQVERSLLLTHYIFENEKNVEDWMTVYQLTSLYSGDTDDLIPFEMKDLIVSVFGDDKGIDAYVSEEYRDSLRDELKEMRAPKVNANIDEDSPFDMVVGLQFRLMGQRYALDAEIMQELMEPIDRPLPTAFDVLSAFGHPVAEEVLYGYYDTNQNWSGYDETLEDMKVLAGDYDGWRDNLYSGWLWTIDAAATSYEEAEAYPELLRSKAWSYKNLSSALGSFAELKHNNLLYVKQPMAEAGGGMQYEIPHYVEPNVEVYSRLLWLTSYTKMNYEAYGVDNEEAINVLTNMEDMLELLMEVSIKELQNETVTREEFDKIKYIGGLIDYVSMFALMSSASYEGYIQPVDSNALIADVATATNQMTGGGYYLEEAIGLPRELYAVCYVNGQSFMARGMVYSYYEFVSEERLTDNQWNKRIGLIAEEKDGYTYPSTYTGQGVDQLEMMPWMKNYISSEPNEVEENYVEAYFPEVVY